MDILIYQQKIVQNLLSLLSRLLRVSTDAGSMTKHGWKSNLRQCRWIPMLTLCFLLLVLKTLASESFDPYAILGIKKDASDKDIRRAYKVLARKW